MGWGDRISQRSSRRHTHALSRAVTALPFETRQAMLAALEPGQVIAGAYTDGRGGACPMLAAHRRGARGHACGFPSAWDRFTGARRPRAATARELDILRALLQESIAEGLPPEDRREPAVPAGRELSQL